MKKQFGFRPHYSTSMAIIQLVDKINSAVERNKTTIGIFLDLSKAFDTIDHNILLYKLEHYGFRGIVLEWFKDYLSNRTQYVSYNKCESQSKQIEFLKGQFWARYYLYYMLMILFIRQSYLILFYLLTTPQYCIQVKILAVK